MRDEKTYYDGQNIYGQKKRNNKAATYSCYFLDGRKCMFKNTIKYNTQFTLHSTQKFTCK